LPADILGKSLRVATDLRAEASLVRGDAARLQQISGT